MKATTAKRAVPSSRRHYHLPQRQQRDSWDGWVGGRRSGSKRREWYLALLVVAVVVGLILWRVR